MHYRRLTRRHRDDTTIFTKGMAATTRHDGPVGCHGLCAATARLDGREVK